MTRTVRCTTYHALRDEFRVEPFFHGGRQIVVPVHLWSYSANPKHIVEYMHDEEVMTNHGFYENRLKILNQGVDSGLNVLWQLHQPSFSGQEERMYQPLIAVPFCAESMATVVGCLRDFGTDEMSWSA
jgi:hypothetical protein